MDGSLAAVSCVREEFEIGEWLALRISWLEMRYGDQEIHENELGKVFSCRSICIVITSL